MVGTAIAMGIHSGMNIRITKQIGDGVNGWSYTRGMGEQLTWNSGSLSCLLGGVSGRLVLALWVLLCRTFFLLAIQDCTAVSRSW